MTKMLRAARLHTIGEPFQVDTIPGLSCGGCIACRRGDHVKCTAHTFQGYFGFGEGSQKLFEDYPYGGFGQFLTAPVANLVKLPDSIQLRAGRAFRPPGHVEHRLSRAELR